MHRARHLRHVVLCLGLLALITSVFTLSLDAKAWHDSVERHAGKHFKATDSFEAPVAVAPPPTPFFEPADSREEELLPAPVSPRARTEPFLSAHLLRAPPSDSL